MTVGLVGAALRRSATVLAVAIVTTVIAGVGLIDMYRLRHGPVAMLATHGAAVSADEPQRLVPP
jgi:hypothetical protein